MFVDDTPRTSLLFPQSRFWLVKRVCTSTSRNVTADAESRYNRMPRRLHHRIVVRQSGGMVAKGTGVQSPSPRHRQAFFRARSWSIDGDESGGSDSLDLCYWRSRADGIVTGRPKFEIKHTLVGFTIGRDGIRFVDGEDG